MIINREIHVNETVEEFEHIAKLIETMDNIAKLAQIMTAKELAYSLCVLKCGLDTCVHEIFPEAEEIFDFDDPSIKMSMMLKLLPYIVERARGESNEE